MPRRSILSATERESLLTLPDAKDELIRLYTFNDADLELVGDQSQQGRERRLIDAKDDARKAQVAELHGEA